MDAPSVTTASSAAEKIALFRRLFTGRADVFPVRWENRKTAKSGYAPACANEWVRGICGKPQVKCGECPHQAFIPVTDDIIEKHLRGGDGARASGGDFVAGVYPLLPDETCWFLAADFDEETGRLTPWPCWRLARPRACPRPLSGLDPAMAGMCGFSSPSRFPRAPLGSLARQC